MNRRGFLKRCSILPFIGSLSAVAKAETSESKKCSCPAPYIADVTKAPVRHFRSCDIKGLTAVKLGFENPNLEDIPENREWLDKVEEIVNAKFISPSAQMRIALKECNFPKEHIST